MGKYAKATFMTILFSILNSVSAVFFNFIYLNLFIQIYGSEINGLISTITQFVSMFSILEGGITTAAIVACYKPLREEDYATFNEILYSLRKVFNKIGMFFLVGVIVLGSIYMYNIKSPISYVESFVLLIICALTSVLSLCYLSRYNIVFQSSNKEYICSGISFVSKCITWIISIILIINHSNVIIVYVTNLLNVILCIIINRRIQIKKYPKVNYSYIGNYDKKLIKGTKDVVFQKIANTIFTSTDLVLISLFISLSMASVYNLYNQIFYSIFILLTAFLQGPTHSFGQLATQDDYEELRQKFFLFQFVTMLISSIILTITASLVLSFISVYAKSFDGTNYLYPTLGMLFFLQYFTQIINRPFGMILNITGNFKTQNVQCMVAAIVNIVVSYVFIPWWGINSIILGSFVATFQILFMNLYYANKIILKANYFNLIKNIVVNYILDIVLIYMITDIVKTCNTYIEWILVAIIVSIVICILILVVNLGLNREYFEQIFKWCKKFKEQKVRVR